MSVLIRKKRSDHFTQIPNTWLRDPRMSLKARGLLCYIYSHSSGYELSSKQMVRETASGRDAVWSALRELEDLGYLIRLQARIKGGKFAGVSYVLCDDCDGPESPW